MGWFEANLGQTKILSHGGNVPDFSAFMALLPRQKRGFILLFNADPCGLPPLTEEIGLGVTALLAGQPPAPIKLSFVPWVLRLLPLIPLFQVANVIATRRLLRRWRKEPALRPSRGRLWGEVLLHSLVPNLSLAAILVYLRASGLLSFMHLFTPDLAWTARISGGFAGLWAIVRSGLIVRARRQIPPPVVRIEGSDQ